jgi:hypothetical protein
VSLSAPHALPAVLGGGFYLAVVALIGLGIGALVRHTAGAITVVVALRLAIATFGGQDSVAANSGDTSGDGGTEPVSLRGRRGWRGRRRRAL